MNPHNYATLESSKRLVDAGIVLETEAVWWNPPYGWILRERLLCGELMELDDKCIPAPSMAEVWRELPGSIDQLILTITKTSDFLIAAYETKGGWKTAFWTSSDNPTDALIDLLIWVRWQKEGK